MILNLTLQMKKALIIMSLFICMSLNAQSYLDQNFRPLIFLPLDQMPEDVRSTYLAEHFWRGFPFYDTVILNEDRFRGSIRHYLQAIRFANLQDIQKSLVNTIIKADTIEDMYRHFIEAFDFHLNDALSPMREMQWIEPVWHQMLKSRWTTFSDSARINFFLRMAAKNPVGGKATDLEFITIQGQRGRLSEIEADLLLVYFYIPGCPQCAMTLEWIQMDTAYQTLHRAGILKGFAFFPEDDIQRFRSYGNIPTSWINARDPDGMSQLMTDELYQMRGAPTIYLLDRNKRIILKDARLDLLFNEFDKALERHLSEMANRNLNIPNPATR